MDNISLMRILNRTVQILLQANSSVTDAQRKEVAEFHEELVVGGSYGTNQYLKYGVDENGRAVLYRTTQNIANAKTPEETPKSYQKL